MEPNDEAGRAENSLPTALVVDEMALVRTGITAVLHDRGIEAVTETRSAKEAVSLATFDHPDVVICGVPADVPPADTVRRLAALRPRPAIVALLPPANDHQVAYAVALGARGVTLRTAEAEEVGDAIDAAMKETTGAYVAPALQAALRGAVKPPPLADRADPLLSAREREVLVLLAQGRNNREIASALSVTLATAKSHLVRIYAKLDAKNRNEALGRAVELGLLS